MVMTNKTMENEKSTAPVVPLPQLMFRRKKSNAVGTIKMPCARSDKVPAVMSMIFLNEDRDIFCKRIAQKCFFVMIPVHANLTCFRLLSRRKFIT